MKHVIILGLLGAGLAAGCPVVTAKLDRPDGSSVSVEVDPNGGGDTEGEPETMRAVAGPSTNPDDYKPLCSLDGGRHCHGCDDPAGCPQEDSGPLCCVGDTCVWSGSHCSGVLGWCFNYSKQVDPASGVEKAVCHDE